MFEETLVKRTKNTLAILGKSHILDNAYLAGGTAIALQLGHRISVDFDFFTDMEFIPKVVSGELSKLAPFNEEQADKGTILGKFKEVKLSLFLYKYPLISKPLQYSSLKVANIPDIAAMKIDAIATRGAKRDFIDLYFICKECYQLSKIFDFYGKKYGKLASNRIHIQKSLVFFEDAQSDEMPEMLKPCDWEDIKKFFENEVKKLTSKFIK